jgi:hypothetical protein
MCRHWAGPSGGRCNCSEGGGTQSTDAQGIFVQLHFHAKAITVGKLLISITACVA